MPGISESSIIDRASDTYDRATDYIMDHMFMSGREIREREAARAVPPPQSISPSPPHASEPIDRFVVPDPTVNVICMGIHAGRNYCGPQSSAVAEEVGKRIQKLEKEAIAGENYTNMLEGLATVESDMANGGIAAAVREKREAAQLSVRDGIPLSLNTPGHTYAAVAVSADPAATLQRIRMGTPSGYIFVGTARNESGGHFAIFMSEREFARSGPLFDFSLSSRASYDAGGTPRRDRRGSGLTVITTQTQGEGTVGRAAGS